MNSQNDFEHEAFLSLWLSRFVFPGNEYNKIGKHVFPRAINLARVQVWAWERLLPLRPEQVQNYDMLSGVRIDRWHNVKQMDVINVRTIIDSSGETFQWRPYALAVEGWLVPRFYKEKEEWAIVEGKNLDQELESFVRCLRVKVNVETDMDVYDVLPSLHIECQQKQVENYPDVPRGFPPKSCEKNDKKNLSMVVSQTMVCDIVVNHIAEEKAYTSTNYADDKNETRSVVPSKSGGENDKKNLSVGVSQIIACQIVPPCSMQKHIAEERVYTSTDYAHDSNESSSIVLPKCNGKNDNENLSIGVCQTMACDVVPPGLMGMCNAGKSVYTSTDAYESYENSSVVSSKCIGINDKQNLSMEVC
ncbi:putative eukaryotic translation initiation factor 2D-like isoform X1 [Capsicum annuum]|nr:putative eukaryotic translation initiation factor 2D-like isoform X1 [Capsicum annuum]